MTDKVYILVNVANGKAEQVAEILRGKTGIIMADVLEGPPDVI
jgi:hypothetical protein